MCCKGAFLNGCNKLEELKSQLGIMDLNLRLDLCTESSHVNSCFLKVASEN